MRYICEDCKQEFESTWDDEDALQEKEKNFGEIPLKLCAIVCDDCYKKYTANFN